MRHPYFTFTTGAAPVVVPAQNIYSATIIRALAINNEVSAFVTSFASQGGTMGATLNSSTIMRASAVSSEGSISAADTNNTAGTI